MGYVTKGSTNHEQFDTGARRDNQDKKLRFDLIPIDILEALALQYGEAEKVGQFKQQKHPRTAFEVVDATVAADVAARLDLVPEGPLRRLAELYARGAVKYGEHNYQKGIPISRVYASLFRHVILFAQGDTTEDHMAAVAWNAFAIMFFQDEVEAGNLPDNLDDLHLK